MTNDEKERQRLNKKLLKETFKDELHEKRAFDWIQFIKTCVGCFIGMAIIDLVRDKTALSGAVAFAAEIMIIIMMILAVDMIVFVFGKMFRRK